jgi:hypothetical protein
MFLREKKTFSFQEHDCSLRKKGLNCSLGQLKLLLGDMIVAWEKKV